MRVVAWYSHGACSAVATKLAVEAHSDLVIACIDTGSEHPDNDRFRAECEEWFGHEVVILKSVEYENVDAVIERTRYMNGPAGARCTVELKKKVRFAFERPDDLQVFGYAADPKDAARATRFVEQNPGVDTWFPLVERGLTKANCLALVEQAGIELPEMYRLGYNNNNCIGCVKGGMGYWDKIREDFPVVFRRRAEQERELGHTILRSNGKPLYLDELEPGRGRYVVEVPECSLDCQTTFTEEQAA